MQFSSKVVFHEMCIQTLKEMGAEVIDIEGIMVFVRIEINENVQLTYLYHRNPDGTFLLERIKPYILLIGEYESEEVVLDNIVNDIDQFTNACKSHKFDSFIETTSLLVKLTRDLDDLFLYFNINDEDMKYIHDSVNVLWQSLYRIKNHSERIYYKTDPQSLKDSE